MNNSVMFKQYRNIPVSPAPDFMTKEYLKNGVVDDYFYFSEILQFAIKTKEKVSGVFKGRSFSKKIAEFEIQMLNSKYENGNMDITISEYGFYKKIIRMASNTDVENAFREIKELAAF